MSAITVQIEVNGRMVEAKDATWYQVAPCGCTGGATVVQLHYSGEVRMDGEAAFGEGLSAAERARDKANGWTYELGHRSEVTDRMRASCPHTPKWGIDPRPTLNGHLWAASRRSRVLHLVTDESVETDDNNATWSDVTALCGSTNYAWSSRWHRVDGKVECKRCIKLAAEASA